MTTRKKTTTGKSHVRRPKLKKETIKDLDVKSKGKDIKGGVGQTYFSCLVGGCVPVAK